MMPILSAPADCLLLRLRSAPTRLTALRPQPKKKNLELLFD